MVGEASVERMGESPKSKGYYTPRLYVNQIGAGACPKLLMGADLYPGGPSFPQFLECDWTITPVLAFFNCAEGLDFLGSMYV
jgi:hypothetical protein